jgi:hypothetical protein
MENKSDGNMVSVPYIVYEGEAVRADRRYKRLLIALIITIVLMFISNALWLYAWNSYDYASSETLVEAADGMANFHSYNNQNEVNYGTNLSEDTGAP